ncbi:MAG: hypothetical protein O2800_02060 [Planctomycetota bacterium]|nr:hypothetical protein [Planctomycetota bacterium]
MANPLIVWLESDPPAWLHTAIDQSECVIAATGAGRTNLSSSLGSVRATVSDPRVLAREFPTEPVLIVGTPRTELLTALSSGGRSVGCLTSPALGKVGVDAWHSVQRIPGFARSPEIEWIAGLIQDSTPARQVAVTAWWPDSSTSLAVLLEDAIETATALIGEPETVWCTASDSPEGIEKSWAFLRQSIGTVDAVLQTVNGRTATISVTNRSKQIHRLAIAHGDGWCASAGPGHAGLIGECAACRPHPETILGAVAAQLARLGTSHTTVVSAESIAATMQSCAMSLSTNESVHPSEAKRLLLVAE